MITQAKLALAASLLLVLCLSAAGPLTLDIQAQGRTAASAAPTSPEKFFGFRLGTDRRIARWDRVVEYFRLLEKESDKIRVVDMGPTTEGNPFLLAFITSPANLARLDRLREINARLSDPRGLAEKEVDALVAEGKAVVVMTMSMHSNEIGGTQMAPELAPAAPRTPISPGDPCPTCGAISCPRTSESPDIATRRRGRLRPAPSVLARCPGSGRAGKGTAWPRGPGRSVPNGTWSPS